MSKTLLTVFTVALMGLTACAGPKKAPEQQEPPAAQYEGETKFFGSMKVHQYRLSNGLRVLILPDKAAPTFAYQTWFKVGSKDEQVGLTGLAHLFEHMMFKETKNLKEGEFDRLLESAGAEGENAFTSRDYTGYIQSLPSDKLDLIARLEAERMTNLIINEHALNTEREVVQNERRFRNDNNPDGQLYEKLYELAYERHSYHWPIIGYPQDLSSATVADTQAFYRKFYAPNNATIVIAGDVDPRKAIETIHKHYAAIPPAKIDRKTAPAEPRQTGERTQVVEAKVEVEKLMAAYHIPNVNSPDVAALEILRSILGEGKSSRLYRKLVDGGIATSVDVANADSADPGVFMFFVNMQKGKTAKQALKVISQELENIRSGQVSPAEIDLAITQFRFDLFDGLASNYSKAQILGFYETVAGSFNRVVDIVDGMNKIDKKAVVRVAQTYLKPENRSVVIGVPVKGK